MTTAAPAARTPPRPSARTVLRDALRNRPLLLFTVGFILGILASRIGPIVAVAIAALGALLALFGWRRTALLTLSVIAAGIGCGALRQIAATTVGATDISRFASGRFVEVEGQVAAEPDVRPGRREIVVSANRVVLGLSTGEVSGAVVVIERAVPGTRWADLDYGDRVRVRGILDTPPSPGNPGAFSWRDYLAARGIRSLLIVRRPSDVEAAGPGWSNPLMAAAIQARERLTSACDRFLAGDAAGVLPAILIGRRNAVPPDLLEDFVRTGTVHLLASAGLHVGILAWWLLTAARALTLPRRPALVAIMAILWLYALMAGGRPSVTRAVVMATIYFLAILFERAPDLPTTLATAALVLLVYQPSELYDSGFQLSFATVGTLVVAMPLWQRLIAQPIAGRAPKRCRKAVMYALDLAGLSLFAQLGSAPIVAAAYNEWSITGLIANLLVVPALFIIMPLGLFGCVAAGAAPGTGGMALAPAGWATDYVIGAVRALGESPLGAVSVGQAPVLSYAAFYLALIAAAAVIGRRWPPDPATEAAVEE